MIDFDPKHRMKPPEYEWSDVRIVNQDTELQKKRMMKEKIDEKNPNLDNQGRGMRNRKKYRRK